MDLKFVSKALVLVMASASFAIPALAQWQWIDKDGRKVYSDRSPPVDIQEKNILKRPGGGKGGAAPVVNPDTTPTAELSAPVAKPNASAPKISGKDAQLEAKKKQAEEEEAAKKKAEEEKIAKGKAENCDRNKKALVTFQSGQRITVTNSKGEREYMDDNAKASEVKRLQGAIEADCK